MSLPKISSVLVALCALTSVGAFAEAETTAKDNLYYSGNLQGEAILVASGDSAEHLYQDMYRVRPQVVDLGNGDVMYTRTSSVSGVGCMRLRSSNGSNSFGCVVGFKDVTTGRLSNELNPKAFARHR
ncbi:MAG: hypothetical protein H7301_08150 [Cryobacterium sp.]|nr:hypothetical protein [Oligoflexia bacterium]